MTNKYEITMQNKDGRVEPFYVSEDDAKSIKEAQHYALEMANSGMLEGKGWVPVRSKEIN